MTLNEEIKKLKLEVSRLRSKVDDLSKSVESKHIKPYSKVGSLGMRSMARPIDIVSGLGMSFGGNFIWNDSESKRPPYNQKPDEPTVGYSKHSHSQFAGGALDISTLELADYDVDFDTSPLYNKHCQGFWNTPPPIKIDANGNEKRGHLLIQWDKDGIDPVTGQKGVWKAGGITNIDVKNTLLVEYDEDPESPTYGQIINQSTLWNEDDTKTSVIWDADAEVFRFFAVYAD